MCCGFWNADGFTATLTERLWEVDPPPSSTVFHFLQVAEVVNTAARNDVRLPGHRWLKPQEVQREDRAAQPEASRGDAGLRTADDRPHCFKGKYTTFHKLIILVIYVIISGYYVTELPAGCLSCFICWLRFLVFNQNFLFSLLAFSMPAYVCQREDEMKTVWWGCSDTLTQTHSLQRPVCFLVSFRSAVQQEMGKWLLCSSATRQKSSLALLRVLRMEQCCLGGLQHACLQTCCLHPPPPLMLNQFPWVKTWSAPRALQHIHSSLYRASAPNHPQHWCSDVPQSKMSPHVLYVFCFWCVVTHSWMNLCVRFRRESVLPRLLFSL